MPLNLNPKNYQKKYSKRCSFCMKLSTYILFLFSKSSRKFTEICTANKQKECNGSSFSEYFAETEYWKSRCTLKNKFLSNKIQWKIEHIIMAEIICIILYCIRILTWNYGIYYMNQCITNWVLHVYTVDIVFYTL